MKQSNEITMESIVAAANRNRVMDENCKKISQILEKYRYEIGKDVRRELADTVRLAEVKAIIAYVRETLEDMRYIESIEKALDNEEYAHICATTTDTTSVEWVTGRVMAGATSDVASVIEKVMGSSLKRMAVQMKKMAAGIVASRMYEAADFVGVALNVTRTNIATAYAKAFPIIVKDDAILDDVCHMAFLKLKK